MSSRKKRNGRKSPIEKKSDAGYGKTTRPVSETAPVKYPGAPDGIPQAGEIRRLISKGETKSAVKRAKQIHKTVHSTASEAVLVEAYAARILEITEKGLSAEAKAMLDMVRERYHLPDQWLAEIETASAARDGMTDEFLAPLNDPSTPPEKQAAILKKIKEQLVDLTLLTTCKSLDSDHPLKRAAAAVSQAFTAVTSGPVRESDVALPEVPRKSPLAPWKMIIRAIACFYRREDDLCERYLKSVDMDAPPGRLTSAVRAMTTGRRDIYLDENSRRLVNLVTGNSADIRKKFEALEALLSAGQSAGLLSAVRGAVSAASPYGPNLVDRLKQHISIRAWINDVDQKTIRKAMGGPSLKNAYFWRLYARAAETKGESLLACALWNEYVKHAVHEGLFAADGPELSVMYLHMANLLAGMADEEFERKRARFEEVFARSRGFSNEYAGQPASVQEASRCPPHFVKGMDFLYPERLYQVACEIAPSSEGFANWLEWMKEGRFPQKQIQEAALAWQKAMPHDIRPLLHLARAAEKRHAFKMCLGYLDQAEQIDALNPDIRKIRRRILAATAMRHLKQRKTHLAEKDFKEMESLPLFHEGDRPGFLAALKWVCAHIQKNESDMRKLEKALRSLMGSELAGAMIMDAVLYSCGLPRTFSSLSVPSELDSNKGALLEGVGRACVLGDDVGVSVSIPLMYEQALRSVFEAELPPLPFSMTAAIAEAALRDRRMPIAYAISGAGIRKGGPLSARYLLLRARALPHWKWVRKRECIDAAIALARKERDMDLIHDAFELRRESRGSGLSSPFFPMGPMDDADVSLDSDEIDDILTREGDARQYPGEDPYPDDFDDLDEDCRRCDMADCPDRRADYVPEWDDEWEADDEWEDDDDWGVDGSGLLEDMLESGLIDSSAGIPPEALPILLKLIEKYADRHGNAPDLDTLLDKEPELKAALMDILIQEAVFQSFGIGGTDDEPSPRKGNRKGARKNGRSRKGKR